MCTSDGKNPVQLTNFKGSYGGSPRWSPDGQQIAFDCRPGGQSSIFVISPEGGGKPRRVTSGMTEDIKPNWSNDGRWIYYSSRHDIDWQIWKIPAEGGEARQVTKNGGYEAMESPDGKYVYFVKKDPGIWRIPKEGGEEIRVLDQGEISNWFVSAGGLSFLDNQAVPHPAIKFLDFATRRLKQLASFSSAMPGRTIGLEVSPDEKWVLYHQPDSMQHDIMLVENFH